MNVLGIFGIVALASVASAFKMFSMDDPELIKLAEDCGKETGADITVFVPENNANFEKLFEDRKYKCFARCLLTKAELASDKGDPNAKKVKERFEFEDGHPIFAVIEKCAGQNKQEDVCDRVMGIIKCIMVEVERL